MVHSDLVDIAFFTLKKEKELVLLVDLHLVYDACGDKQTARGVLKRLGAAGNRNAVLDCVLVAVGDEVFGADENSRRTVGATGDYRIATKREKK